ncbi:MAG: hypothetical protein ACFFE2_17030, partial [Candidatus Thorarchaeota archaeon]
DRDRSLETKIELQREGIRIDPTAQVRLEVEQRSVPDHISLTRDLIRELDDKKRKVTKKEIDEFFRKRR